MPKVTMYFSTTQGKMVPFERQFDFKKAGHKIRELVAAAASTEDVVLRPGDVDFIPVAYPPNSIVDLPISFEIETIGFPARKEKLCKENIMRLKDQFHDVIFSDPEGRYVSLNREDPLIWVKFQDPEGCHV